MKITLAKDQFDQVTLDKVIAEMRTLGAPVIRCYEYDRGHYVAIEGSHRLRACEQLGIKPELVVLPETTPVSELMGFHWDNKQTRIIAEIGEIGNYTIEFD